MGCNRRIVAGEAEYPRATKGQPVRFASRDGQMVECEGNKQLTKSLPFMSILCETIDMKLSQCDLQDGMALVEARPT
jgi:hypothetical protein